MKTLVLFGLLTVVAAAPAAVWAQSLAQPEELYKRTEFNASLALLDKHSNDPASNFLVGRNYYMLGEFKRATDFLQKATEGSASNGEYMDWLGRAYGKRAETSNPLMAPGYASKARQAFEKAVELDPKNSDVLSDLFDFYLEAPGFLGGGYDKAEAVSRKVALIDPPEAYFERAKLAQKRKEFDTAEKQLRQAIAATPHKMGALLEYAKFLSNEGRTPESDAVLAEAQRIQPDAPKLWYTKANLFIKQKRNLQEARNLLQMYMRANITVDDPPKDEAARLLQQVGGA